MINLYLWSETFVTGAVTVECMLFSGSSPVDNHSFVLTCTVKLARQVTGEKYVHELTFFYLCINCARC